jgi:hypothetical protein
LKEIPKQEIYFVWALEMELTLLKPYSVTVPFSGLQVQV